MVTFPVDDVTPAVDALPSLPLGSLVGEALVVGGDPALPVLAPDGVHPLLGAVARAFAEHRPLVLSPDTVWLTIAQGVAQHVRLHAEQLRPRLVGHAGRKRLAVTVDGPMPRDAASWADLAQSLHKLLAAEVRDADLFDCDFSTSTDVERTAGRVVLLDVYSPYFAYWLTCICGIPSITLTGTVEDWEKIRSRIDAIAGFGLQRWCRSLAPIADQFVRAAAGDVDTSFWRRIYNPVDAYGGDVVTGWVARMYPYLATDGTVERPNPLLDLPIDEPRNRTVDGLGYSGPGVATDAVPATLSRVVVTVNDLVAVETRAVALHAGLIAVAQDDAGAVRPVAGWYLAPAEIEIDDVVDRIVREHDTTPPAPAALLYPSVDLVAIYRRIGSATLFDGAWRLLAEAERRWVDRGPDRHPLQTLIDLADGRCIAAALDDAAQAVHWVSCRVEQVLDEAPASSRPHFRTSDEPGDIPVYGTSLALLLATALDSGGDIGHLETGRLDQLDRAVGNG
jgi:hypothetical protein